MGFADLSIAELVEDYQLDIDEVVRLCRELGIPFVDVDSFLALEDAKRIILWAQQSHKSQPTNPRTTV